MPAYDKRLFKPPAPVAMVTLVNPDTAASLSNVVMLIDSGADVTLLPRSAVTSLSLSETGESYRLSGFDGTTNQSRAVRARLSFLGKNFEGAFLQIDSEVGVIGRNILNSICVALDGPRLHWEIQSTARQA
jgi:hypothetical protein